MSSTKSDQSLTPRKRWMKRLLLSLLVLLVVLSLIRAFLPLAIKIGTTHWLQTQHVEADMGEVEISFLDGTFAINNLSGKNKAGKGFALARLDVAWQWGPLWDHQAIVEQINISSLYVDATLFENGDMNIAGLDIKAAADKTVTETTEPSQSTPWDVTIKNINLSNVDLCLQQLSNSGKPVIHYCGKLADFNWAGNLGFKPSMQSESSDAPPLYAQGNLNINGIRLHNQQLDLALLDIGSVTVKEINIETPSEIKIEEIGVGKFSALQRAEQTTAAKAQVVAFEHLSIQPLKLSQLNNLSLGTIELTNASSFLLIKKDGSTDFAQWLPEKQKEQASKTKDSAETTAEPFHFAFDEFIFTSSQHFTFVDESLKETFTADIHDIKLKLSPLDNSKADNLSHVSLALTINKHGLLKLDADVNPLSTRPSLKGRGEIAGLDLRMAAPLTKQHIGHNIKSGQLDSEIKLNIDKGIIDSNLDLVLHQFELESLSNEEAKELNSEFGFPLSSSLSLLRDKDNAIRLSIPVGGDIDSPEFNPKDAIIKASSAAITAAVLHYYTPFGLIFAAESLFDLATALNFDPVLFEAGKKELNAAHKEQLEKLSALMTERPGIHLTLCGISNNTDKDILFPAPVVTADKNKGEKAPANELTEKPLSKENVATLKKIAEARSATIKNYLVNEKKLKASRLIECSPEYLEDDIAGVKINI